VVNSSMLTQIDRLRRMTVGELQQEWQRLYGESTRSRQKAYLFRRLAWRCQELALGGLSDRAKARLAELAPDGYVRARTPTTADVPRDEAPTAEPPPRPRTVRDIRLPVAGTVLTRHWHGVDVRVLVLDDGFEWDGHRFDSLSEVARAITGQRWSGPLFFGLRQRTRRS